MQTDIPGYVACWVMDQVLASDIVSDTIATITKAADTSFAVSIVAISFGIKLSMFQDKWECYGTGAKAVVLLQQV